MKLSSALNKARRVIKDKTQKLGENINMLIVTRDESKHKPGALTIRLYENS